MDTFDLIRQRFELDQTEEITEEQLIMMLARRISEMLDDSPELLFSTLYRLDIYESKINMVLKSDEDTALGLARLVLERQKEKMRTKAEYKARGNSDDFIDI